MKSLRAVDIAPPLLVGVLSAMCLNMVMGPFMYSGRNVATGEAVFAALAFLMAALERRYVIVRVASVWVGVQIGLAVSLFLDGGSNIWPIGLAMYGMLTSVPMSAVGGLVWLGMRLFKRAQ